MTGATVIRWGASIPGREAKGLEVFAASIERFEGLAKQGRIHSHKEFIALDGRSGGFMVVEGDIAELQKIAIEPETLALNSKAASIVQDFEIQTYLGGTDKSVQDLIGIYLGGLGDLGYV